jgi:general secretion pathway protein K
MTAELYYGTIARTPNGAWIPRAGLRDCLATSNTSGSFDINTVQPAVMFALGMPPEAVAAVLELRRNGPILPEQMTELVARLGPASGPLTIGGSKDCEIRATARVRLPNGRLSELRRTASLSIATDSPRHQTISTISRSRSGPGARPMIEAFSW